MPSLPSSSSFFLLFLFIFLKKLFSLSDYPFLFSYLMFKKETTSQPYINVSLGPIMKMHMVFNLTTMLPFTLCERFENFNSQNFFLCYLPNLIRKSFTFHPQIVFSLGPKEIGYFILCGKKMSMHKIINCSYNFSSVYLLFTSQSHKYSNNIFISMSIETSLPTASIFNSFFFESLKKTSKENPFFCLLLQVRGCESSTYNFFMVKQKFPLNNRNFEKI